MAYFWWLKVKNSNWQTAKIFLKVVQSAWMSVVATRAVSTRPQLFKRWIALSSGYISIQWIAQLVSLILIHWIVIYPVDSVVQPLNNRGQICSQNWAIIFNHNAEERLVSTCQTMPFNLICIACKRALWAPQSSPERSLAGYNLHWPTVVLLTEFTIPFIACLQTSQTKENGSLWASAQKLGGGVGRKHFKCTLSWLTQVGSRVLKQRHPWAMQVNRKWSCLKIRPFRLHFRAGGLCKSKDTNYYEIGSVKVIFKGKISLLVDVRP